MSRFLPILFSVGMLLSSAFPCLAQSSSFMPGSPVPSLWEKSASTIRGFVAPSDPGAEFIHRAERAVKVFWRDLINEPYQTGPGAKAFGNAADSIVYIITDNGTGTGLIIDKGGLVLTDWHVVKDAKTIAAVFRPKSVADLGKNLIIAANVVKIDSGSDLALLQLPHPPGNMKPVTFGDASKVRVGDQVFSIGLPTPQGLRYGDAQVTELHSTIAWSEEYSEHIGHQKIHIQPLAVRARGFLGSSGGPLLNAYGAVIGVKAFADPKTSQIYAVPADVITSFLVTVPEPETENVGDIESWAQVTLTTWRKNGILKQFDTSGDGVIDRIGIDSNQNTYVDAWIVDEDQNGVPDYLARDVNKNGRYEKRAYDKDGDGTYETHYFDHNNNEVPDVIGTDVDGDGTVDVFAIIRKRGLGSTNIKSHLPPPPLYAR